MSTFTIEMLPARHGDALWIEYGKDTLSRVLIDAGPIEAFPEIQEKLGTVPQHDRDVELLVITHVDTDHIDGVVRMLAPARGKWSVLPQEIWFNGYKHMRPNRDLGGKQGEFLSALIHRRANDLWNKSFDGNAVKVEAAEGAALPVVTLPGGMKLTILSPDSMKLEKMAKEWDKDIEAWATGPGDLDAAWTYLAQNSKYLPDEGLVLGPEEITEQLTAQHKRIDPSHANGSSIAFLAEYAGKSCLFLADAHADRICASISKLIPPGKKTLKVDAVKMSHHGSRNNLTKEFMKLVDAKHYLFSSNGAKFEHPDAAAVEAVIVGSRVSRKPILWFNYKTKFTDMYEQDKRHGVRFQTRYPDTTKGGISVAL